MTPNEARYAEDLPDVEGLDVISMGLADVIYDIKSKTYYTPNTKMVVKGTEMLPVEPTEGGNNAD